MYVYMYVCLYPHVYVPASVRAIMCLLDIKGPLDGFWPACHAAAPKPLEGKSNQEVGQVIAVSLLAICPSD
jgi:hypothetical protein